MIGLFNRNDWFYILWWVICIFFNYVLVNMNYCRFSVFFFVLIIFRIFFIRKNDWYFIFFMFISWNLLKVIFFVSIFYFILS